MSVFFLNLSPNADIILVLGLDVSVSVVVRGFEESDVDSDARGIVVVIGVRRVATVSLSMMSSISLKSEAERLGALGLGFSDGFIEMPKFKIYCFYDIVFLQK